MADPLTIDVPEVCRRAFALMAERQFVPAEQLLANCLTKTTVPVDVALLHSASGVSAKLQGRPKEALRHYQRAEKILPDDPALKLITAQLLIDEFAQYDQAVKRCRAVYRLVPNHPVVMHHARTLEGLACARRGLRAKALELLATSIINDFRGFVSVRNIDFQLVHWCLKKQWDEALCRRFLETAHRFAQGVNEGAWVRALQRMLDAMSAAPQSPPLQKGD